VKKLEGNYSELEQLVQTRQKLESTYTDPDSPYVKYKTDINYADIHGNTLLHYAAALGDLAKVQEYCMEEKIDINCKNLAQCTPLIRALAKGHSHVSQYLYEQGADCDGLQLHMFPNHKGQEWLRSLMEATLAEYLVKLKGMQSSEILKIKESMQADERIEIKKYNFLRNYSKNKEPLECLLNIATQLNDSAAVTEILSIWTKALHDDYDKKSGHPDAMPLDLSKITKSIPKLLIISAEMNHQELCTLLLSQCAEVNPKNSKYTDTPLFAAVRSNQISIVRYFLEKGANPNCPARRKQTPLMLAIAQNNVAIAKELLTAGADVAATDVDGNTAFHYAAKCASPEIMKLFLSSPKNNFQNLASTPNIYGYTPLDIAIQHKNDDAILMLAPNRNLAEVRQLENYGRLPIKINQTSVLTLLRYYFRSEYRSLEFFADKGHCNGFEGLEHYYSARGMRPYYFDTLALIASLDANIIHDKKHPFHNKFASLPQAQYHKNIYTLLEQWANDIIWFQHDESIKRISHLATGQNRLMQYKLISFYPIHKSEYDYVLLHHMNEQKKMNEQQFTELFSYLMRMPNGVRIRLVGDNHATSIYIQIQQQKLYFYYDSNLIYPTTPVTNLTQLLQRIIDYKYIVLGKYTGQFEPAICTFCFKQDLAQLNLDSFKIFQDEELPNSKTAASAFQQQSASKFTHLHIAIMTHSLPCVKKLLDDGFCDLNAVDFYERSVLDLALRSNNKYIIEAFLHHIHLIMEKRSVSTDIVYLYENDNRDLVDLLVKQLDASHLIGLFFSAIEKDDLPLAKVLVTVKGISVNHCSHDSGYRHPLKHAMEYYADNIIVFLLKNNASVIDPNAYDTPLELSITKYSGRYYKKLIESNPLAINQFDAQGRTALHIALLEENLEIFKDLLDRGADILLKSPKGPNESAVQMLGKYSLLRDDMPKARPIIEKFKLAILEKLDMSKLNDRQALYTMLLEEIFHEPDDTFFKQLLAKCDGNTAILEDEFPDSCGRLLYQACTASQVCKFALLLKSGCNPNQLQCKDDTPLLILNLSYLQSHDDTDAQREARYKMSESLLDHHADVTLRNDNPYSKTKGKTALDLVNEFQDDRLKKIFGSRGLLNTPKQGM